MHMTDRQVDKNRVWKRFFIKALLIVGATLLVFTGNGRVLAQGSDWTRPTVLSTLPDSPVPRFAWFPDIAIDELGLLHVVWCQTIPLEDGSLEEQVSYTHWDGTSWSEPNDIVSPSPDIVRNAIVADLAGNVHLLFGGSVYSDDFALYHHKVPTGEAWLAGAWSTPHRINQGVSYMGDMAVDSKGVIHVIYDDTIHRADEEEPTLSDISYRHSTDGGQTWSVPVKLSPEPGMGSARPYIEVDNIDTVHVTWDVGWDRLAGEQSSDINNGVYVFSLDGGETWASPAVISYPDAKVVQLTVGSSGEGGVMLVWRATSRDEIFYQWSTDGGRSWGAPSVISQVFARPWTTPFDMYDMATDSAGRVHLLVVGRDSPDENASLGIHHLIWDGANWTDPMRVFAVTGLYPEYPKIVVHEGNQLHAVWFTREGSLWDSEASREVWYSSSQAAAPYQAVAPLPTPTPKPATPTPVVAPTVTPYPKLELEDTGLPDGLYTESDNVLQLAMALSPVALVILIVAAIKMGWLSKLRR